MIARKLPTALIVVLSVLLLLLTKGSSGFAFRSSQPARPEPSVVGLVEKGKPYDLLLMEGGIVRHHYACIVQDIKDNWIKCDGGLAESLPFTDTFKGTWFNSDHILKIAPLNLGANN